MIPDIAHIRAILAEYDPHCALLQRARPGSGIANTVLYLTTTREELILRIFADDVGSWKPQKERTIFAHMRSLGIPVPVIHKVDASKRVVPFIYSLSARIEGEPFSRAFSSLSDTANARIYAALGDYLGRMHATIFEQFGDVRATTHGLRVGPAHELIVGGKGRSPGPFARWREMHDEIVRARLHLMKGTEFEDLIPRIEAYFSRHQDTIDYEITPRLLHMDLHRGNVLVANGEVAGILDVEESIVGHNEYDLMRTELANFRGQAPAFAHAFMRAYGEHVSLDEGYRLRKDFYDVSRTLVWIQSLILYGDTYAKGLASQSHHAARAHLLSLTSGR